MKNKTKIFFGVLLLLFGLLILSNNTGLLDQLGLSTSSVLGYFWPALFFGLGGILIYDRNYTPGTFFLILGVSSLSSRLFDVNFGSVFFPLILISIGLSIILRKDRKITVNNGQQVSEQDRVEENIIFWGVDRKIESKNFKGGEVNTIFGGAKLDLRDVKIAKEGAKLDLNCIFGGIEVLLPTECKVITNGTGILGGWNPNIKNSKSEEPILEIDGVAILGGVDIQN